MPTRAPIIIIDDNTDDLLIYTKAFASLNIVNKILTFSNSQEALEYLQARIDPCFFVLCDINMPEMNGFELRAEVNKEKMSRYKSVPFLFFTVSNHPDHRQLAYQLSIQGYFQKPTEYKNVTSLFKDIVAYWSQNLRPKLPTELKYIVPK